MDESIGTSIGRNIREIRARRGMPLRAVGELAGFSAAYLSMIERGERPVDKRSTLEAFASALRVAPTELTGTPYPSTDSVTSNANAAVTALRLALAELDLSDPAEGEQRPFAALRAELSRLNVLRQACDFAELGRSLPPLLRDLHAHVHGPDSTSRREALIGLVDCYEAARAASKHLGVPDLSQVAARHVRDVTDELSGPEWSGLAAWSRAQAIGSSARERALVLTRRAADELSGDLSRPEVAEVYGSLHLVAALSSTAMGRFDEAEAHIDEAEETATRNGVGDNFANLYFGAGNVATWRVLLAVERGEGGKAAEIARTVDPASLPASGERRSAFYLDLGRGLATERATWNDAVVAIRRAEEIAPQKTRANPFVKETVTDLVRRARRDAVGQELRGMAFRMGVA